MSYTKAQAKHIRVGCIPWLPNSGDDTPCEAPECITRQNDGTISARKDKFCLLGPRGYGHPIAVLYTKPTITGDAKRGLDVTFVKVEKASP
jgi:hypothetical protein